jgi:phosphotransferase system HPr-like phosphotransfer protein
MHYRAIPILTEEMNTLKKQIQNQSEDGKFTIDSIITAPCVKQQEVKIEKKITPEEKSLEKINKLLNDV